jgi:hypothetical protein
MSLSIATHLLGFLSVLSMPIQPIVVDSHKKTLEWSTRVIFSANQAISLQLPHVFSKTLTAKIVNLTNEKKKNAVLMNWDSSLGIIFALQSYCRKALQSQWGLLERWRWSLPQLVLPLHPRRTDGEVLQELVDRGPEMEGGDQLLHPVARQGLGEAEDTGEAIRILPRVQLGDVEEAVGVVATSQEGM